MTAKELVSILNRCNEDAEVLVTQDVDDNIPVNSNESYGIVDVADLRILTSDGDDIVFISI